MYSDDVDDSGEEFDGESGIEHEVTRTEPVVEETCLRVKDRYESKEEYCGTYRYLLKMDKDEARKTVESRHVADVPMHWEKVGVYRCICQFTIPREMWNVEPGHKLRVESSKGFNQIGQINVIDSYEKEKVEGDGELSVESSKGRIAGRHLREIEKKVTLFFEDVKSSVPDEREKCDIWGVFNAQPYNRMKKALEYFLSEGNAYEAEILGAVDTKRPSAEDIGSFKVQLRHFAFQLNESQKKAINVALHNESGFTLIQGPPGTGKTTTIAGIVSKLREGQRPDRGERILVCGSSNVCVTDLARCIKEGIGKKGLCLFVSDSSYWKNQDSDLEKITTRYRIRNRDTMESRNLVELESDRMPSADERKRMNGLRHRLTREVLNETKVVCCTCIMAGSEMLKGSSFDTVIVDDATRCKEPEVLIPLMYRCRRIVLVGDRRELGPTCRSDRAKSLGYDTSIFDRLIYMGKKPVCLDVQYRMHPSLCELPSILFYGGRLQSGISAADRKTDLSLFNEINENNPTFFWHVKGKESHDETGVSWFNREEANCVSHVIHELTAKRPNRSNCTIGVITPYAAQRTYIRNQVEENPNIPMKQLTIELVDAFQGGERDYIILSCVRSNDEGNIGFVRDRRRLNVALTRARFGLIIIGDMETLSTDDTWRDVVEFYRNKNLLYEGKSVKDLHQWKRRSCERDDDSYWD